MIETGVDVGGSDTTDDIDGDIEDEKDGVILNTNEVDSKRDFGKVGDTGVADIEDVGTDSSGTVCVKVNGVFDTVPETDGVLCLVEGCILVSDIKLDVNSDFCSVAEGIPDDSSMCDVEEAELDESESFCDRDDAIVDAFIDTDGSGCVVECCIPVSDSRVDVNSDVDITIEVLDDCNTLFDSSIIPEVNSTESGNADDIIGVVSKVLTLESDTGIDTDGSGCVVADCISVSDIIVEVNSDVDIIADVLIDGNTLSDTSLTPDVGSTDSENVDNKPEVATKVLKLESVADTVGSIDLVINSVTFGD